MKTPNKKFVNRVLGTMDYLARVDSGDGLTNIDAAININLAICNEVAQDVWDCADRENFCDDDVRMAIGRVLCKRLGITEPAEVIG